MNRHMEVSKILFVTLTAVALSVSLGCSTSSMNRKLDEKLAAAPSLSSSEELREETSRNIENSTQLSTDQKARLMELRTSTRAALEKNREDSMKLRAVLIQDVLSPKEDTYEIDLIKTRLRNLENKRLSIIFSTVDQASEILGKQAHSHARLMSEIAGLHEIR